MSKKQTAVQYAEELIKIILYNIDSDELERIQEVFDEAIKMEKQQAKMIESEQKVYSYDDLMEAFVMGRLGETIKKFNGKFKNK